MTNLYLRIKSERYEVDCGDNCKRDDCIGCMYFDISTRTVRLVTKRDHPGIRVTNWFNTGEVHIPDWKTDGPYIPYKVFEDEQTAMAGIVAAYRDKTLPPAISEGLEEIDVKEVNEI